LLFKSFSELKNNLIDLNNTVHNIKNYYAHLPTNDLQNQPEKLSDHVKLVNDTALKLVSLYELEYVINNIIKEICISLKCENSKTGDFVKELFLGSIHFHDFGKVNENFQVDRMQNAMFSRVKLLIGNKHSILSAFLFINVYLKKLEELKLNSEINTSIGGIICAFADTILKHHSKSIDVSDIEKDKCDELTRYLPMMGMNRYSQYWESILNQKKVFEEEIFVNLPDEEPFALYVLLKLNFSLLTAADYLATLSYQYNFTLPPETELNWFGVLSQNEKKQFYIRFKESTPYNRRATENNESKIDLLSLKGISNKNLNKLRNQMLLEVVSNIKANPDKKLFYLKAPTAAGKTNISIAATLEMLQQDEKLNKVFYVFPFTTLVSQTYKTIKDTLKLDENQIIQLHSRAEWHIKNSEEANDGIYHEWENHIDNLFVHYPFTLLSHIKFFDILKSNKKEINYLLHRMANSIVVIDELQSYSPKFWDHVNYFITHYSKIFNIRFLLMSATLPEIGRLTIIDSNEWVQLIERPELYFQNPNFSQRTTFDFSLLKYKFELENYEKLNQLADIVESKAEEYSKNNKGSVKVIIEFITKRSAGEFLKTVQRHPILKEYKILILTGTVLEPRRQEIITWLKDTRWMIDHPKVLLISTQVVEAGVDIDMDIGFKDTSLIDSDEQLAGRVNRNANNTGSVVYLFNLDGEGIVYKGDERLSVQRTLSANDKQKIYNLKNFDFLYDKIIEKLIKEKTTGLISRFRQYKEYLKKLHFREINREFQLIQDQTKSIFVPLSLPMSSFSNIEQEQLLKLKIFPEGEKISGKKIFQIYENIIKNRSSDFIRNRDYIHKIQSLLSKFTISVYPLTAETIKKQVRTEEEIEKHGYIYWADYSYYYSYETGLNFKNPLLEDSNFI
jgi:CRISPR-associated endonuclease/helicase Cas3